MDKFGTAALAMAFALAVTGSQASAADGASAAVGGLAPGKPAGVHQAVRHRPNLLLIGGAAVIVVAAVAVAIATSSNSQCATCDNPPATTGTN